MRVSIRPRSTTAKAASWPLISGSLVGNKSSWLDESFTFAGTVVLDPTLIDKKLPTSVSKPILRWRACSKKGSQCLDISLPFQSVKSVFYTFVVQTQKPRDFISSGRAFAEPHQNFFLLMVHHVVHVRLLIQLCGYQILSFVKLKCISGLITHSYSLITFDAGERPRSSKRAIPIVPVIGECRRTRWAMRQKVFGPLHTEFSCQFLGKSFAQQENICTF
jgi:hypothetical protein